MRAAITADFLRKLPAGPCDVWDTRLTGLILRVQATGHASWAVVYGRGKRLTLGRSDVLTPTQARERAREVLGEVARGEDPQAGQRRRRAGTLKAFLESQYTPWATANRKTGADTAARIASAFGDAYLSRPIADVTAFALEQWRTARRRAGIKDTTINRDLDALRGVLSKAVQWGVVLEHPMRQVRRAKVDTVGRLRYLNADEEQRLREALVAREDSRRAGRARFNAWRDARGYKALPDLGTYADHITPIVLVALNTGLRRGELLGLHWPHVDLIERRLAVRGASAKSGLTRYIPLNEEAVTVLEAWRASLAGAHQLVFPGPTGDQMASLKTAWKKVAASARLEGFTFHDLRHTFASKLVQAGVDLNTVRELLGHRDIKMTLRYAHLASEHKAAAVAKLVARG